MPYCSNCGRRIYADDNFCSGCGRPVSQVTAGSLSSGASYTPAVTEGRRGASTTVVSGGDAGWSQAGKASPAESRKGRVAALAVVFIVLIVVVFIMGTIGVMIEHLF